MANNPLNKNANDTIREIMHPPELPSNPRVLDQQTFRMDDPEDSVTVDPIRVAAWIRPHDGTSHAVGIERKRSIDAAWVRHLEAHAKIAPDFETYLPTTKDLDSLPKFSKTGFQCWRGLDKDHSRDGQLPRLSQLNYSGVFTDVDTDTMQAQLRAMRHRIDARIQDCSSRGGSCR